MKKIYLLSLFILTYSFGNTQIGADSWKLYPAKDSVKTDSTLTSIDTVYDIVASDKPGTIKINKDSRIDLISNELGSPTDGVSVKLRGYRLQLIASNKKAVVDGERAKFLAVQPNVSTYTDYIQPNYKLKVGDFKTKLEAQKLQHELKTIFPQALVVNDLIELSKQN